MTEPRLKISPPWVTILHEFEALFDGDPEIAINYDNSIPKITVATNNGDKATALLKLLPEHFILGNIKLEININGPFTNRAFTSNKELIDVAFYRNPVFAYCEAVDGIVASFTYVVFKNCVVQFFNDNLDDIHGVTSTLYEDIARDILVDLSSVVYNTDVESNVGKPLGEWP